MALKALEGRRIYPLREAVTMSSSTDDADALEMAQRAS